jgi:3-methyladenine DNA glycosylase AlkC
MITYNEIHKKSIDPQLTVEELNTLLEMEKLTDKAIETKYVNSINGSVSIDARVINQTYKNHPTMRQTVILTAWKKKVNEAGWEVSYAYENEDYILKGKDER